MHHTNQMWTQSNSNAFGSVPQPNVSLFPQQVLTSPASLSTNTVTSMDTNGPPGPTNNMDTLQALVDLVGQSECGVRTVGTVPVHPLRSQLGASTLLQSQQLQQLQQTLQLQPEQQQQQVVILMPVNISLPQTTSNMQNVVPNLVPNVAMPSLPALPTVNGMYGVNHTHPVHLNQGLYPNPRARIAMPQRIDRETLELANRVFSLYEANGLMDPGHAAQSVQNVQNVPSVPLFQSSNRVSNYNQQQMAGSGVQKVNQHVALQKQSVIGTDCAKPQKTTHSILQSGSLLDFQPRCAVPPVHTVSRLQNGIQSMHRDLSKKWRCRYCDKDCGSQCRLEVHLRIHTGDQPYKCTIPGCGKAFKQKVNLKRHLNKHLNNGDFACEQCDRRFVYKCDLTAHLRVHSGVKPFGCTYCGKKFNQKRDLSRHLNAHHARQTGDSRDDTT